MIVIDRPQWSDARGRALRRAIEICENSGATVPVKHRAVAGWWASELVTTYAWARFLEAQLVGGQLFIEPKERPLP